MSIHNPLYVQILSLRGNNSGYFELTGVHMENGKYADITILIDSNPNQNDTTKYLQEIDELKEMIEKSK